MPSLCAKNLMKAAQAALLLLAGVASTGCGSAVGEHPAKENAPAPTGSSATGDVPASTGSGGSATTGQGGASGGTTSGPDSVSSTATGGASSDAGGASGNGGSGSSATLDGEEVKSCETYCMTDADCCAELGLGDACPNLYPARALCQIQPDIGWDHVCRDISTACLDDAECQGEDPELICAENAPQWCSTGVCPGLNTCLPRGCSEDADCEAGYICIVRGRVGQCERACASQADCDAALVCQGNVYAEDPRAICIQQANSHPVFTPMDPVPPECTTDTDCDASGNGPRCNGALGLCGCGSDADCSANERCR